MTTDDQFLAELRSRADRLHTSTGDADRPPVGTWSRVLASISPNHKEETLMNAIALPKQSLAAPVQDAPRSARQFMHIAASLLIIVALAFGGWFAAMQLNDPAPDPRFAVLASPEATAGAGTCDVEPLSVDRVIEIVENPADFMAHGPTEPRAQTSMMSSPPNAALWELEAPLELTGDSRAPNQDEFDAAAAVADQYVNCMVFGTQGHVWNFYSPAHLQASILAEFPVYASPENVRARVEERINEPAYTGETAWNHLPVLQDIDVVMVNPDPKLAIIQGSESSYFDQVMSIGVSFTNTDGEQIALTNGTGRDLIPHDPMVTGSEGTYLHIVVAKIRGSESWLIIPWPSDAELGIPVATP